MQPVHVKKFDHRWQEVDRTDLESGSFRITKRCLDCRAEMESLHVTPGNGPKIHELPLDELAEFMTDTHRNLAEFTEGLRSMFQQLVMVGPDR